MKPLIPLLSASLVLAFAGYAEEPQYGGRPPSYWVGVGSPRDGGGEKDDVKSGETSRKIYSY